MINQINYKSIIKASKLFKYKISKAYISFKAKMML